MSSHVTVGGAGDTRVVGTAVVGARGGRVAFAFAAGDV